MKTVESVFFWTVHYLIKLALLTFALFGELLSDRSGLLPVYALLLLNGIFEVIMLRIECSCLHLTIQAVFLAAELVWLVLMVREAHELNCWWWLVFIAYQTALVLFCIRRIRSGGRSIASGTADAALPDAPGRTS